MLSKQLPDYNEAQKFLLKGIHDEIQERSEWNDVFSDKKQLPDSERQVLCFNGKKYFVSTYYPDIGRWERKDVQFWCEINRVDIVQLKSKTIDDKKRPLYFYVRFDIGEITLYHFIHLIILKCLQLLGGNKTKTSQLLNISRRTIYDKIPSIKEVNIE